MALFLRLLACLLCAVQVDANKLRSASSKSASKAKGAFEDAALSLLGDHASHVQTMHEFAKLAIEAKRTGGSASAQHMLNVENSIVALYKKKKRVSPAVAKVIKTILHMLEDQMMPLVQNHSDTRTAELNQMYEQQHECNDQLNASLTEFDMAWQTIWRQGSGTGFVPNYYPQCDKKDFNDPILTAGSPAFVRRICGDCEGPWKEIYLRLESAILPFSQPFTHLMETWLNQDFQSLHNLEGFNTRYSLYSSFEDAKSQSNRWTYCEDGVAREGFPGRCAPSAEQMQPTPQWFSLTKEGGKQNIRFEAYTVIEAAENPTRDSLPSLAEMLETCVTECCMLISMPGHQAGEEEPCGGYCSGTWPEDYGVYHLQFSPNPAPPPAPTCEQQCPGTYSACQDASTKCQAWSDVHDCTGINSEPFPTTEVCDRGDFESYGSYLTSMVDYWTRAISNYDAMESDCEAAVADCYHQQQNVCPCDENPAEYGERACTHPEPETSTTTTTTTTTSYSPICPTTDCSYFQRKLDTKSCEQSKNRIDECNDYNSCWMDYQRRWNETWWRICYPPYGDRYTIQTEAYGLERVKCILQALNHGISIRGQEEAPGGRCENAPRDSCGYWYQSFNEAPSLAMCECPQWITNDTMDPGFLCAVNCTATGQRLDHSESPPELMWPATDEFMRPASLWVPNQRFESQLDGILECQARERDFYSTSAVDITECERPWPDYGPFTPDNCSEVIHNVVDRDHNTSGTEEYVTKFYTGYNIQNPAPCLSSCCLLPDDTLDVDDPLNISHNAGVAPAGFRPLTNLSLYDEVKKLKLLHSEPGDWQTLYATGSFATGTDNIQLSEYNFNNQIEAKWDEDGTIIRRECQGCLPDYQELYLKIYRRDAFPSIYQALLGTWPRTDGPTFPNAASGFRTDYNIFARSFENAIRDRSPWRACYGGVQGQGFPGTCAPYPLTGAEHGNLVSDPQWNGQAAGGQQTFKYSLYQGIRDWGTANGNQQNNMGDNSSIRIIERGANQAIAR